MIQSNNNFNLIENLQRRAKEIGKLDRILTKGLYQPFNCANSGPRKLMHGTHLEHTVEVKGAEPPFIGTGYEQQFGEYNSSTILAEGNYEVISIISKFSFNPKLVYYVIVADHDNKVFRIFERREHEYTNETYGYSYNTNYLDRLEPGYTISKGAVIRRSKSYDEYGNRMDGVQANTVFLNTEKNMEDSLIVSESFCQKTATIKYGTPDIMFNSNDIPLNIYGGREEYKSFPDVGEEVKNGLLCVIRRDTIENCEYTQTFEMLSKPLMSDDRIKINGFVYDIDINVNDPEILQNSVFNRQLYKYYVESVRFRNELIETVEHLKDLYDYSLSYELDKMYYNSKKVEAGAKYTKDRGKEYSNTRIIFYIAEYAPLNIGDKLCNRFGGKGVVSHIFPDVLMPYNPETGEYADIIASSNTCTNRENPGQIFELHLNSAARQIVIRMYEQKLDTRTCLSWICSFLEIVCPQELDGLLGMIDTYGEDSEEMDEYVQSIFDEGTIKLSMEPITESVSIDTLDKLYKAFPFIHDPYLYVPIKGSNGKYRLTPSRREIPFGSVYMYRLKQHSEDKFSATSLSSTNIRGLNTKSKANKEYRILHGRTPIQFGNMETGDMANIGMEYVVYILMIHSVSPSARMKLEEALTGDPYDIDIRLDDDSANRNVEIINAYLKTGGLRLMFKKILKTYQPAMIPIEQTPEFRDPYIRRAMYRFHSELLTEDYVKRFEEEEAFKKKVIKEVPFIKMASTILTDEQIEMLREFGEID